MGVVRVFKPGDLVTFTDHLALMDGNSCLFTHKGKLVADPYDKAGRQWVVMALVPKNAYGNAEVLSLLCPIAEGPAEHEGEKSIELPEGTFGLIEHDTYFQRGAATVAPESSLRRWRITAKGKAGETVHSIAGQPEWQDLDRAFWKLWSTAVKFPVERWTKLEAERKKVKAAAKDLKKK